MENKFALSVPKNAGRRVLYKTAVPCRCLCSARPFFGRAAFSVSDSLRSTAVFPCDLRNPV